MSKLNKKYMHTIAGIPAIFLDHQIYFAERSLKLSQMADSLEQIRQEESRSKHFREYHGYTPDNYFDNYGYLIIYY